MRHRRFDWVKFFVITGLIVLIIGAIGVYAKSLSPYQQLRGQAEKIATNRANLKTINGFWWYNRDKSYLTVAGNTKKNQAVYVVIQEKTDIGYLSKSGKLNYVTYSFRSGEQLNAIKNL